MALQDFELQMLVLLIHLQSQIMLSYKNQVNLNQSLIMILSDSIPTYSLEQVSRTSEELVGESEVSESTF